MDLYHILFYAIASLIVISAAIVAFTNKIIYAAFSLLFTLLGFAILYIYLSADFIAVSQILIYVGGILILIIFGVMLTTKIYDVTIKSGRNPIWTSIILSLSGGLVLALIIFRTSWNVNLETAFKPITKNIGFAIMNKFLLPFEIASILLLAALIGAVLIARSEEGK